MTVVATLALVVTISAWIPSAAHPAGLSQSPEPFVCSVTHSDTGFYGNGALETMLPPNGRLLVGPGGRGEVLDDGRLSVEWKWQRKVMGPLSVAGVRYDVFSPLLDSRIPNDDGAVGPVTSRLIFSAPGCWQITGRVGLNRLTFMVVVEVVARVRQ